MNCATTSRFFVNENRLFRNGITIGKKYRRGCGVKFHSFHSKSKNCEFSEIP